MQESASIAADDRVVQVRLLTPDECDRVVADVAALRRLWVVRRARSYRFHTLGAASYLDADGYYDKAARFNPNLDRSFGWLHQRLLRALGERLGCRVALVPRAARPGFHIMRPGENMAIPGGNRHFDLQFSKIEWDDGERIDFSRPISFTVAIRLPRSGGGLHIWSIGKRDYDALDETARAGLDLDGTVDYVPYEEGGLVCHSGLLLHTNAPSCSTLRPDDVRLTLQGHGVWCEGTYLLYW